MNKRSLHILIWTTCMQACGMWVFLHLSSAPAWTSSTLDISIAYTAIFPAISGGAAAVGSLFSARLISRWGTTESLIGCLILLIIGISSQMLKSLPLALFGAVLIGLAYAITNPAASALLTTIQTNRTNLVFSIKQSGVPFGAAVSMIWGINATDNSGLWVALPIGTLLALILTCPKTTEKIIISPAAGVFSLWKDPFLSRLLIVGMTYGAVQMIVLGSFPSLIESGYVSSATGFLALSIGNALGLVGRVFWGLIADRLESSEKTLAIIGLTTCILVGLLLLLPGLAPIVFLLAGFVAVGWNGVFHAAIRLRLHDATSSVTATVMAYLFASGLLGQLIFSSALDNTGAITALSTALLIIIGGTCVAFSIADRSRDDR
ncbi:MAG: MFS transporter [Litorivicinaceae bacterium]